MYHTAIVGEAQAFIRSQSSLGIHPGTPCILQVICSRKKHFRCVLSEAGENIFGAHISIYYCCILEISKQSLLWSNGKQPPLASLIPARVSDSDSPQPNLELQLLILCKTGTSSGSALQFCAQWGRLDPGSPGCIISICQSTPNTLFLRMGAQWAQPTNTQHLPS